MIYEKIQTKNSLTDLTNLENSHLSLQLSLDGLEYCVFDKDLVEIIFLKEYEFEKRPQTPEQLLENVKEIYTKDSLLSEKYESVHISHKNNLATLVPEALYDKDYKKEYLKYSVKVLESDSINVDKLHESDSKNIYIPFQNINTFLYNKYESFTYTHASSVLISSLLKYYRHNPYKQFFVNVSKNNLDILFLDQNKLQLFNSFLYYSKEDFLYYILFAMEQLSLNPDKQTLTFLGAIDMDSILYKLTYTYVRNIGFLKVENLNVSEEFYQENPHIKRHHFFELLNQL